jgi:hypothetical protein
MMEISPAVMVHSLAHIERALALRRPVTLLSGPGAALYAGCLWWQQLLAASGFTGLALLDCADAPGRALEALKLGLGGIVLTCPPAVFAPTVFAIVSEIATAQHALVLPQAPKALDLAQNGAVRHLEAWLEP